MPSAGRRPYIAGNWKMHKTVAETWDFIRALLPEIEGVGGVDVGLCVPYTALTAAVAATDGTDVIVSAQNMHQAESGAFTGEVSAAMLTELHVRGVVLGHSERREYYAESDRALGEKVPAALAAGLVPILCVGETEEERENDETQRKLRHQVQEALDKVPDEQLADVVIAYEPIWAIGTGQVATPEQAQEAIAFIRALVGDRSQEAAERVRVQYGGSVKPDNAAEILRQPDIDGALVGGASLDPNDLARIVAAAQETGT
jgi:triosephosphate isomerase (TIM)